MNRPSPSKKFQRCICWTRNLITLSIRLKPIKREGRMTLRIQIRAHNLKRPKHTTRIEPWNNFMKNPYNSKTVWPNLGQILRILMHSLTLMIWKWDNSKTATSKNTNPWRRNYSKKKQGLKRNNKFLIRKWTRDLIGSRLCKLNLSNNTKIWTNDNYE